MWEGNVEKISWYILNRSWIVPERPTLILRSRASESRRKQKRKKKTIQMQQLQPEVRHHPRNLINNISITPHRSTLRRRANDSRRPRTIHARERRRRSTRRTRIPTRASTRRRRRRLRLRQPITRLCDARERICEVERLCPILQRSGLADLFLNFLTRAASPTRA